MGTGRGAGGVGEGREVRIRLWSEKEGSGGRTTTLEGGWSEERTGVAKRIRSRKWPDVWVG